MGWQLRFSWQKRGTGEESIYSEYAHGTAKGTCGSLATGPEVGGYQNESEVPGLCNLLRGHLLREKIRDWARSGRGKTPSSVWDMLSLRCL